MFSNAVKGPSQEELNSIKLNLGLLNQNKKMSKKARYKQEFVKFSRSLRSEPSNHVHPMCELSRMLVRPI